MRCVTREDTGGRILKLCILASSSSGNSIFITTGHTRILIDAGLCRREIFARLEAIGEDPYQLDAILVTHEHSDHISGLISVLRGLAKRDKRIPVHLTHLTAPTIAWDAFEPNLQPFQAGRSFSIGDLEIDSFTVPHDAADPVGYCIRTQGLKIGIVTDLGYMPESIPYHLRKTDLLVLESNHDLDMLKVGPYPWSVKQRVMGRRGHLSNDVVSKFIASGMDSSIGTLVLGHLSEHNNYPALVEMVARQALEKRRIMPRLVVSKPGEQSECFSLEPAQQHFSFTNSPA